MNAIKRQITHEILKRLDSIPAVAILGSRQAGKTTLAKQIQQNLEQESIYIDLESPEDIIKLSQPESYLNSRSDKLIIIDEIQRMPGLFPILRSVIDNNRKNGRFILLGSASPDLLIKSSESLAGRISYFELDPFVFEEIKDSHNFNDLWLKGGYPEMLLAKDLDVSYQNRLDFIKTYIERDLPLLGIHSSPVSMRSFIRMIAHVHGNILNYSDFSRSMGIRISLIKQYFDFLEHSFLIRRLQPYYHNISKRLIKTPKVYFRDSGIFHTINGIKNYEDLAGFNLKGNSWEGFVIQQIHAQLKPTTEAYFYKTHDGAELDLVLVSGNKAVIGIEIKYSNTPSLSRGTTISARDLGSIPVLIITPSATEDFSLGEGKTISSFERCFSYLRRLDLIF